MNSTQRLPNSLTAWLAYLDQQHSQAIDLGLERIRKVAKRLGLTRLPGKVILIAGTNGKGSTSRFLEAYLLAAGFSTGLFNSPHIKRFQETVRINGNELTDDEHCQAFAVIEQSRGDVSLTAFEVYTLAAFELFKAQQVDYAIIEVGLGGRQDATNVIEPDISVITTIALDHQAYLGDDRESIGYHKAGIFRPQQVAVVGDEDIPASVIDYASQLKCPLIRAQHEYSTTTHADHWQWHYHVQPQPSGAEPLAFKRLSLAHIPQQNVATGLAVLHQLGVTLTPEAINQVLSRLIVEGRFEIISQTPLIIIDVAHNPQAAQYLAAKLAQYRQQGYTVIGVVGMLKDKDAQGTLANIYQQIDSWHVTDLAGPRGGKAQRLQQVLEKLGISKISCYDDAKAALIAAEEEQQQSQRQAAQQADNQDKKQAIIIFGSFHTINQALADSSLSQLRGASRPNFRPNSG